MYDNLDGIDLKKWSGLKSIIEVKRTVILKEKETKETAYFISSLPATMSARKLNKGVRNHWKIESFHHIKDVTFREDKWKVKTKNAPANYSLIRNLVINIFRRNGFESMQATIEKCANNVPFMWGLF